MTNGCEVPPHTECAGYYGSRTGARPATGRSPKRSEGYGPRAWARLGGRIPRCASGYGRVVRPLSRPRPDVPVASYLQSWQNVGAACRAASHYGCLATPRVVPVTTEPLSRLVRHIGHTLAAADLATVSDDNLLARFREARDPAAFEAIVRRHGPRVLAACRKVLRDDTDVDDAFQATFVVLMNRPGVVRESALGSWLFGVAHRV